MEKEIWKDIPWYEWLYQVSNMWQVHSFYSNKIKKSFDSLWYCRIWLYKNKKEMKFLVHRLVAMTFLPNILNLVEINHINWIKNDNRLENLEWCTRNENIQHAFNIWLKTTTKNNYFIKSNPYKWKFWIDNPLSKKIQQFDLNWNFIKLWYWASSIYKELWINNSTILKALKNDRQKVWNFIWKELK